MNTSTTYFVWTTRQDVSRKQEAEINRAVKAIDQSMIFVRFYAAGNDVHGWLERDNDGTNNYNWRRADNRKCVEIAQQILSGKKAGAA